MSRLAKSASRLGGCVGSAARTVTVVLGILVGTLSAAHPQQWRSFGNDLMVLHQLSKVVISEQEAKESQIFVDPVRNVSNEENQQLRGIVLASLRQKIRVVEKKEDANFWLQIILQQHKYPITNAIREPAHGSLTLSICRYPIKQSELDCENFVYYYFSDAAKESLFTRVFPLWIEEVFPPR
jgi:hypothetical protein